VNDTYSCTVTIKTVRNGLESVTTRSTGSDQFHELDTVTRACLDHYGPQVTRDIGRQMVEEAKERMARE
jgi:hypothetical protein